MRNVRLAWAGLVLAVACLVLAGCGGLAFRVVQHRSPTIDVGPSREIWFATDVADATSQQVAQRLASSLRDVAPTRVVREGAEAGPGVLVVSLAVERLVSYEAGPRSQTSSTCMTAGGGCSEQQVGGVADAVTVRLIVRITPHDGAGGVVGWSRVVESSETADDALSAELRGFVRAARAAEALFRSSAEEVVLPVEELDDARARQHLAAALEGVSSDGCAALAADALAEDVRARRARVLYAAGQCERALALSRSAAEGVDLEALGRARTLLGAAMDASPRAEYARALSELRTLE